MMRIKYDKGMTWDGDKKLDFEIVELFGKNK